jgi:hypothetical protein
MNRRTSITLLGGVMAARGAGTADGAATGWFPEWFGRCDRPHGSFS